MRSLDRFLAFLRSKPQVVRCESDESADHRNIAEPFQWALPEPYGPRNMRIRRQSAVKFRLGGIMQHVDDARAADSRRIIYACMGEIGMFAKLRRAVICDLEHVFLAAKMQATR